MCLVFVWKMLFHLLSVYQGYFDCMCSQRHWIYFRKCWFNTYELLTMWFQTFLYSFVNDGLLTRKKSCIIFIFLFINSRISLIFLNNSIFALFSFNIWIAGGTKGTSMCFPNIYHFLDILLYSSFFLLNRVLFPNLCLKASGF